ncbi:unnamed protein product [Echinostoma caproni]|uniref:Uncharacterized protein n=1 Tax=Echinostoma caproni TaxID=27848 RepID=A0A183AIT2_9TREM|nr:unnamed protein product [Echinostoma caproni]
MDEVKQLLSGRVPITRKAIDKETFIQWLKTLIEMQTVLEFLYVQSAFGPVDKNHRSLISTVKRKELTLGQDLRLYPISPTVRQSCKTSSKPYRVLPVRSIEQRIDSYELFKPRLLSVIEHNEQNPCVHRNE